MFNASGEALYVGKSCGTPLMQRLSQHLTAINPSHQKPWRDEVSRVDATAFDSEEEAGLEEKRQIRRLVPKYNTRDMPPTGATLPGLDW